MIRRTLTLATLILLMVPSHHVRAIDPTLPVTYYDALLQKAQSMGMFLMAEDLLPSPPIGMVQVALAVRGANVPRGYVAGDLLRDEDRVLLMGEGQLLEEPKAQSEVEPAAPAPEPTQHPAEQKISEDLQYLSRKAFAVSLPSIGLLDLTVTHPDDPSTGKGILKPLHQGIGHLFSYPGEAGTTLLYGHSSNWPWDVSGFARIFREINRLEMGEKIFLTHGGKLFVYRVTAKETIPAADIAALQSTNDEQNELILYTCWPPDDSSLRYIVRAELIETYADHL